MAENFFSILKTECIYRHHPATFDEARILIDNYMIITSISTITSASSSKLEWRRSRCATPLKTQYFLLRGLFCAVRIIWDCSNLSPGERKKLLLTRALLRDAPFLLLDEPLNHLDEDGKRARLAQLEKRRTGLLLISHVCVEVRNTSVISYFL